MKKLLRSFAFALNGIRLAIAEQQNMKIHILTAVGVIVAGFYFDIRATEWCIIILTIALVLGFEMMNSAVENVVDLITTEHHPLAGKAKDIAAGAVLVVSIMAVIVGVVIFKKYVFF